VPENAASVPLELGTGRNEQRSGIEEKSWYRYYFSIGAKN